MSQPFFSIIIPIYNIDIYLAECIQSVLSQDFGSFEVILVNDGSTDESLSICKEYQLKDNRIKVIDKINEGLAETRNKGLELSQGKYIIFLDGDDHLEKKGKGLSEIHSVLYEENIDILLFNLTPFSIEDDSTYNVHEIKKIKKIKNTDNLDDIFKNRVYLASACNKIVRKELISQKYLRFPKGLLSEDIKWCGDLLRYTDSMVFYSINFYYYRQNREGSITFKTSKKNLIDIAKQVNDHYKLFCDKDYFNKKYVDEYYSFYYLSCIKQMCEHEEFSSKEIVSLLNSSKSYLGMSHEKRIVLFRIIVNFLGFKNVIKLSKYFYRYKVF